MPGCNSGRLKHRMEKRPIPTSDLNSDSPGTVCWNLTPEVCPLLTVHHMARVGVDDSAGGFERVRTRPGGSFIMETESGEGRILLEGKWQKLTRGDVALAPPRVLNAFYTPPGRRWKLAFVRYEEPPGVHPLVDSGSPLRLAGQFSLALAVEGLRQEWEHARDTAIVRHWLALIDVLARRLALPWRGDDRLAGLWDSVKSDLARDWTLPLLAKSCGLSTEHLRRLCLKSLGRSPMEHLTYIRVQRAQELLETTRDKLNSIAHEVGYATGHAFSRAFFRCVGKHPSECRLHV